MEKVQDALQFIFEVLLSLIEGFFLLLWNILKGIFSFIGSFIHKIGSIIFDKTANWVALALIAMVVVYIQQHVK